MRYFQKLKKVFFALGFLAALFVGYISMNVVTSCKASAQCLCEAYCIAPSGISTAIESDVMTTVLEDIVKVTEEITTNYLLKVYAVTAAVTQKIKEVKNNLLQWWDTFWYYNLEPALKMLTRQLSYSKAAQSTAIGMFTDAMSTNRVRLAMEEKEIESHRRFRPSEAVCTAGTVAATITSAQAISHAYALAAPSENITRGMNDKNSPAKGGAAADIRSRWDNYVAKYCDPDENNGAAGCTSASPLKNRDLDITGEIFTKKTIDVTNDDTNGVIKDLITNISQPVVRDPVRPSVVNGAEGPDVMQNVTVDTTKHQVVYDTLYYIVSRRVPGRPAGSGTNYLGQIAQAANVDPSLISDNPSRNEILQVMMNDRYRTGSYGGDQIDETENGEREAVTQEAFEAMQMSEMLDLLDRYSLLLAAQAGAEVGKARPLGATGRTK